MKSENPTSQVDPSPRTFPDVPSEGEIVPAFPRRARFHRRQVLVAIVALAATLSVVDHLFGRGNDWANLDGATASVAGVVDASAVRVTLPNGGAEIVRLVGIDAPFPPENSHDTDWSAAAVSWLGRNVVGRVVTLRLEPTQTRDSRGELLASVYPGQCRDLDLQSVNQQLISAGLAFASQADPCQFHTTLRRAESQARRQSLGLWSQTVLGHVTRVRSTGVRPAAN